MTTTTYYRHKPRNCDVCGGPPPYSADDSSHDDCEAQLAMRRFARVRPRAAVR